MQACFPTRRGFVLCAAAALMAHPLGSLAADTLYVVVSNQSPVRSITQKEVLALYTGRVRSLAHGEPATPLDQDRNGATREAFYLALTGMDIARINSYWARLHFTGQVKPPTVVGDDAAMIQRLRADPTAVGYLSRNPQQDAGVRVLLRLGLADKES